MVHNTNNDDEFAFAFDSPTTMSPWNPTSPFTKSPWSNFNETVLSSNIPQNGLIGSLFRQEGHIYSLSIKDNILYTGSDSKNIRVWKNMQEFAAFRSNSGFIKAIILSDDKIFTGHQDGKIRVWKISRKNPSHHKRVATLPMFFDVFKASIRPKNYVKVKRKRSTLWIKHADAISCMSMSPEKEFLYSGSWDSTFKVWRVKNSKCVESVKAHDDAVNAVVAAIDGVVYTGSADGTVKVWRREEKGNFINHSLLQTLLSQECAITALAVNNSGEVVYGGSSDGLVNFWEWKKGFLSHGGVLKGHKLAVLCLATAGSLVVSGSVDKSICVWRRVAAGVHSCLSVLSGHAGPVKCLAVEEDMEYSGGGDRRWVVYSGSLDKSVNVWSISEMVPRYMEEMNMVQHFGGGINWETVLSQSIEQIKIKTVDE